MPPAEPQRGLTVRDCALRYRVSGDRVRAWIRRGERAGLSTADPGHKPRYVVTLEALEAFEKARAAAAPPRPKRRRRRVSEVDYYP
jgi:hypothetical protein